MNDDMPWVNLTQEEVDQLRKQKHELTQYGKEKLRQLMNNQEPYPDEMFEEAERREAANYYNIDPRKTLEEMTRQERVDSAKQEIWYLVQGGQNGKEYADSILYIIQVLESLV